MTNNKTDGVGSVVAAVAGGVVGAGVAVAGAMALTDKKTHEEVKEKLMDIKDQAVDFVEGGKEEISKVEEKVEKKQ